MTWWGLVPARVRAHRALLAAALLTTVLATTALAALAAFAGGVGDAGLRHVLERRSPDRAVLDAASTVTADDLTAVDASVRAALRRAFAGLPVAVSTSVRSGPYALPRSLRGADATGPTAGRDADDRPDLTLFATLDRDRVRMVRGAWPPAGPARAGRPVPVALPEAAARRLGLGPGDTVRLTGRLDGVAPVRVRVTGVYRPRDRSAPYWHLDPLAGEGVRTVAFTTYGPLAVDAAAFAGAGRPDAPLRPAEAHWQGDADFSSLTTARVPALRDRVRRAVAHIGSSPAAPAATATTELPQLLDATRRSSLVARSALLVAGLQLALLAGLALLLAARLPAAERAAETALLRARGASRAHLAAVSAAEALLLAMPAAVAAPPLAVALVRALAGGGPLAGAGLRDTVRLTGATWWTAAATALACAVAVVLPALRTGPAPGGPSAPGPTRRRTAAALLRGGTDVALLGVAVLAYAQLRRRADGVLGSGPGAGGGGGGVGGQDVAGASGEGAGAALGIDPVLAVAPALALLAGAVLVLRLLPVAARLGERAAARGRGLAGALAAWHLSRQPQRVAGPALLLVLALATGVLAVGQGAGWDASQRDQADFRTGGDVAVDGSTAPPFGQGGLLDGLAGVTAATPVAHAAFAVDSGRSARLLALDTRAAAHGLPRVRADLRDGRPLADLLGPLAPPGAGGAGLRLPGGPRDLRLTASLAPDRPEGASAADARTDAGAGTGDALAVTVEDRYGVPYRLPLGDLPADGRPHTLTAGLSRAAGGAGSGAAPAGPLRLTRLTLSYTAPTRSYARRLTVTALRATGPHGAVRPVPLGTGGAHGQDPPHWSATVRADDPAHDLGRGGRGAPRVRSTTAGAARDAPLVLRYATGSAPAPVPYEVDRVPVDVELAAGIGHAAAAAPLAALATDAYLAASGARVGDEVAAQVSGTELTVRLAGAVHDLPTGDAAAPGTGGAAGDATAAAPGEGGAGVLLVDLGALDRALLDRDARPLPPDAWWLAVRAGEAGHVAAELRERPGAGTVVARTELAARLRGDPLGAGPRAALTAVAAAGAVLAAAGFAASAAGAAGDRAAESSVLRALGASRRRVARVLAAEQAVLVLLSAAVGLGLGALLTRLVVPLLVLTSDAARPVPPLLVRLPAGPLAVLAAGVLAAPLLVTCWAALRRTDPATALRTEREE